MHARVCEGAVSILVRKHVCLTVSWNSFWVKTNWCSCRSAGVR